MSKTALSLVLIVIISFLFPVLVGLHWRSENRKRELRVERLLSLVVNKKWSTRSNSITFARMAGSSITTAHLKTLTDDEWRQMFIDPENGEGMKQ